MAIKIKNPIDEMDNIFIETICELAFIYVKSIRKIKGNGEKQNHCIECLNDLTKNGIKDAYKQWKEHKVLCKKI